MTEKSKRKLKVKQDSEKKRQKIAAWLGICVAITAIISFTFNLPQLIKNTFTSITPQSTRFYGIVIDETGQPIADAEITVQVKEGDEVRIGFDKTESNGEFNFLVKENPKATVWVTVIKDGHIGFQNYKNLMGNTKIIFRRE